MAIRVCGHYTSYPLPWQYDFTCHIAWGGMGRCECVGSPFRLCVLGSSTLTFDRRELRIAIKTTTYKHDGIVRPVLLRTGLDIGFIEAKPERHYVDQIGTSSDRNKVLSSMVATLRNHNITDVIVAGILCDGCSRLFPFYSLLTHFLGMS